MERKIARILAVYESFLRGEEFHPARFLRHFAPLEVIPSAEREHGERRRMAPLESKYAQERKKASFLSVQQTLRDFFFSLWPSQGKQT